MLNVIFPIEHPADDIAALLKENDVRMLGINTALGPEGCFGLSAVEGREAEARQLIDQAIDYAVAVNARHINVLGGSYLRRSRGGHSYRNNLRYACEKASHHGLMIVIEPLNPRAVPDYHLSRVDIAADIIHSVGAPNLKIMFDFFHAQIVHGDLETAHPQPY